MNTSVRVAELAGLVLGTLMCASMLLILLSDLRQGRQAESPAEAEVGRRQNASNRYRLAANVLLWLVMVMLVAVRYRRFHWLLVLLGRRPLILFGLVLGEMVLLTLNNLVEFFWRRGLTPKLYGLHRRRRRGTPATGFRGPRRRE